MAANRSSSTHLFVTVRQPQARAATTSAVIPTTVEAIAVRNSLDNYATNRRNQGSNHPIQLAKQPLRTAGIPLRHVPAAQAQAVMDDAIVCAARSSRHNEASWS